MDESKFFPGHGEELEDFWGRQENGPRYRRDFHVFGEPLRLTSNRREILRAVEHSLPLYSAAPARDTEPLRIHVVAREMPQNPGPPPDNLFDHIQYSGFEEWLALHLGPWGMAYIDLAAGRAIIVVAPSLAEEPEVISRCVLNTVLNNFMESRGFSMVHASSLVRKGRPLLLLGPDNSGKSTTALRLALAGFTFIADSQIYVAPHSGTLQLLGFPVGRAKLRADMVPLFPELRSLVEREMALNEQKFGLDLRHLGESTVRQEAITDPAGIDVCLISRGEGEATTYWRATREEIVRAMLLNGSYWHTQAFWQENLQRLQRLADAARGFHLRIGRDEEGIVGAVVELCDGHH